MDQQKKKMQKAQRELIMKLIEQENNKGLFKNNTILNSPDINIDGPQIDIQGPSI